jgi:signal transduction histidine kinase
LASKTHYTGFSWWLRVWRLSIPAGVVLALLFALRDYTMSAWVKSPAPAEYWIVGELAVFLFWSLVTPLVLFVMNRFPLAKRVWPRNLAVHVSIYVCLATIFTVYYWRLDLWQTPDPASTLRSSFWSIFYLAVVDGFIKYYGPILIAGYIAVHFARLREQEFRAATLASQLARAQLRALKMQLQPHFLFNTLHSISSLVYTDARRADRMIAELSDLLRLTLEERDWVTVAEEIEYVKKYLQIEQTRFSDRLSIHLSASPDSLGCAVPALILQPIVENAVKHGIARKVDHGTISVETFLAGGWLRLRVVDNGTGSSEISLRNAGRQGLGLKNTQERLAQVYPNNFRFQIQAEKGLGTVVDISIPAGFAPTAGNVAEDATLTEERG